MSKIELKQRVQAPISEVFHSWSDFGNIYKFHPDVESSPLLKGSVTEGLGAQRQCNMVGGKNWVREEVTQYLENERLVIDIYDGNMPMKRAEATLTFKSLSSGQTEVTFLMDFEPGMGIIGKMMTPMMKMKFKSMLTGLLKSNANHLEKSKAMAA